MRVPKSWRSLYLAGGQKRQGRKGEFEMVWDEGDFQNKLFKQVVGDPVNPGL